MRRLVPRLLVPRWVIALGAFAVMASVGAVAVALRRTPPADWRHAIATSFTPRAEGSHMVEPLSDGGRVELTLDAEMQHAAERLLDEADPIQGAAVLVSVDDGRVLALAGRHRNAPQTNDVYVDKRGLIFSADRWRGLDILEFNRPN